MGIIVLQEKSSQPKYKQIVASIEAAVTNGELKKGDKLPSLNSIKMRYALSRDTVLMAYNELKTRGIVQSVVGKGYYLASESITIKQSVFLLFDEFNSFKEDLYNSFIENLGNDIQVDIFFHHFDEAIFSKLIYGSMGRYSHYVIMPANIEKAHLVIDKLPKDSVYVLDQTYPELSTYASIYQNFERDIVKGLSELLNYINAYKKMVLVYSEDVQPKGILSGFKAFCKTHNLSYEVVNSIKDRTPVDGEVYVLLDDRSLIRIIKKMKEQHLVLAKNIGIVSYNETMLKEIVEGGITTISTNFNHMGGRLAEMIINKEYQQIENPSNVIVRASI
ncbi:GntR family transcriptional regulator [Sediminibacter sp. Hel_I_10]|uniref:GntR family transcriptional regulator n=1 Tax=Sediminibacter sp. Hel_I_10 TaxID=1392490 RepID=UPI00047BCCC0|nr:GntR family transcriptional regulator [Sediminibacter sp. Hel_I_10]